MTTKPKAIEINWKSVIRGSVIVICLLGAGIQIGKFIFKGSFKPDCKPIKKPEIATFIKDIGVNSYGFEFRVFNDNEFNGTSQISFSVVKDNDINSYLRMNYFLPDGDQNSQYCGVDTHLSAAPYTYRDASAFRGIRFRVRWKPKIDHRIRKDSSQMKLILEVEDERPTPNAFLEKQIDLDPDKKWHEIIVLYNDLQSPWWDKEGTSKPLDSTKIFKIGFLIKGSNSRGIIELDDIYFYK